MQLQWSSLRKLTDDNINQYVSNAAGVYLLWAQLKNDRWRCFYVGQTDDLERRLHEHLAESEENECIKNHVVEHIVGYTCAIVDRQSDRDGIEKYLYDYYEQPECNKQDPGGDPIEVNVP